MSAPDDGPVIILTAAYGEGHNAAARGLRTAFAELGVAAEVVDLCGAGGEALYARSRRGYISLINRAPSIWKLTYYLVDRFPWAVSRLVGVGKIRAALARLIEEKKPRAVISVYPLYAHLIEQLWPGGEGRNFALHTVVTDSISINAVWHHAPSDTFFVPNAESAAVMQRAGVARERLQSLGFPVPLIFARQHIERPDVATPRVLFMVNAMPDQAPAVVERLLGIPGLRLTVTYGRDEALGATLRELACRLGREIELHGWTDRMPELLAAHHLLIGKAGGASVQEATAARTPMIITHVVPGQEEGNARLLALHGCGAVCGTPELIEAQVRALFTDDARLWREWSAAIAQISKPDAALHIARAVLAPNQAGL